MSELFSNSRYFSKFGTENQLETYGEKKQKCGILIYAKTTSLKNVENKSKEHQSEMYFYSFTHSTDRYSCWFLSLFRLRQQKHQNRGV